MSVISIRANDDEKKILDSASKAYGCKVSSMIKKIADIITEYTNNEEGAYLFFERLF